MEPALEPAAVVAPGRVPIERRRVLEPQDELQLAKLERLEAAPRFESLAKGEKVERGHGLEHVDLRHHHLENGEHALQGRERARGVLASEQGFQVVELVEHLLEPQLVDLMDDDEQRLVVLGAVGQWALERQQLVELEIAGIGDGHRGAPPERRGVLGAVSSSVR